MLQPDVIRTRASTCVTLDAHLATERDAEIWLGTDRIDIWVRGERITVPLDHRVDVMRTTIRPTLRNGILDIEVPHTAKPEATA